jgi:DNA-binding PadR family transcriptional regulator
MGERRRVAGPLALAVLATLLTKPMHPYEMASVMKERGKDRDMPIKWGSLYRVVQNLEKYDFVRAVQSERQGGRPERTVYALTDAGRAELRDWMRELVADPTPGPVSFKAALSLLGALSPGEVRTQLTRRIEALTAALAADRAELDQLAGTLPPLLLLETEYDLVVRSAELGWIGTLHQAIADGSMPGLADWQEYYRSGAIPPAMREQAERGTDPLS